MAKLVSKLEFIADNTDAAVALALHDTADFILLLIRLYSPVDTGFLRDSYEKQSVSLLHILIGSMVNYSIFQEYGTSTQSGTPHVSPAFAQGGPFFQDALSKRMLDLG